MVIYSVTINAVYASKMTLFMETIILDTLQAQNWWLCKVSLWDYLESVKPSTAFDFEIQRGIVKNIYLDTILDSIIVGEPFPPLTLLVENPKIESSSLIIDDFYILDGLQRTYRLWIYKQIIDMAKAKDLFGPSWRSLHDVISEMRQRFPEATQVIPYAVLQKMFTAESNIFLDKLEQAFKEFNLYLYIWGNLTEKEVVNKMLLLNAGQMRVSLQHQYELMFLRVFSDLNIPITLVRTKDSDYMDVKRGIRQPGQFLFTTLVIGLRSFIECFLHDIESLKDKITKIDPAITAFIRKYWMHDGKNPYLQVTDATTPKASINPKIATFIYDVRCAIVHNKESEFHITYSNVDKYRCLLPLMKEILSLMPGIIMRCLNRHNVGIAYSVKELKLY